MICRGIVIVNGDIYSNNVIHFVGMWVGASRRFEPDIFENLLHHFVQI